MKRVTTFCTTLILLIIFSITTFSAGNPLESKYTITEKKCYIKVNGKLSYVKIPLLDIINKSDKSKHSLFVPLRRVFEDIGATVEWNPDIKMVVIKFGDNYFKLKPNNSRIKINGNVYKSSPYPFIKEGRTMMPIDLIAENCNILYNYNEETNILSIESTKRNQATIKTIKSYIRDSKDVVTITFDKCYDYKVFDLKNPNKIVVDFHNATMPKTFKNIDTNANVIKSIRVGQFDDTTARVVLDVSTTHEYALKESLGRLTLTLDKTSVITPKPTPTPTPSRTLTPLPTASDFENPTSGFNTTVPNDNTSNEFIEHIDIKHFKNLNSDKVIIGPFTNLDFKYFGLSDPSRVVIDIQNTDGLDFDKNIPIVSSLIKTIRTSSYDNKTRIVLDLKENAPFNIEEKSNSIELDINKQINKGILYHNNNDRKYISFDNIMLAKDRKKSEIYYSEKYDSKSKTYSIKFNSNLANYKNEFINVNDPLLKSIEIKTIGNFTTIKFLAKKNYLFEVYSDKKTKSSSITLIEKSKKTDRLIVIDPGHGGSDPGAVYKNVKEKDLNLDISLRLNNLLKKANVKTYMIREVDEYVGLYERANIANSMNATLFVSIHNNAYYESKHGSETLYFPNRINSSGFTSKIFAEIIQDKMLTHLGTLDRGIVERPNLVVLKATKMPAILAEVAFITNVNDRAKLLTESFKQKAAESLCKGIIESLNQIP